MTKPREISITVRMDDKHDERAVRLLLKTLLRRFGLVCTRLQPEPRGEGLFEPTPDQRPFRPTTICVSKIPGVHHEGER